MLSSLSRKLSVLQTSSADNMARHTLNKIPFKTYNIQEYLINEANKINAKWLTVTHLQVSSPDPLHTTA